MKSILITGAASGLGLSLATYCLAKGYIVFGTYRNRLPSQILCKTYPDHFIPLAIDVSDEKKVIQAVKDVRSHLNGQPLFALINNAAFVNAKPLMHCSEEDLNTHFKINTIGAFFMMKHFMPLLNASKTVGRIMNINSIAGQLPLPFQGAYGISKTGLSMLSKVFRLEQFPGEQIPIIDIWLGMVRTGLHQKGIDEAAPISNSIYERRAIKMIQTVQKNIRKALTPNQAAKQLFDILNKKKPRYSYLISKSKWKIRLLMLLQNHKIAYRLIRRNYFGKEPIDSSQRLKEMIK